MNTTNTVEKSAIANVVRKAIADVKITDIHTHIYSPNFGDILLWGVDELVTYHYLIAETMRWMDMPYENYWQMSRKEQADLIWKTLFIDHSPYSEACRGVLTVIKQLGLDVSSRNLDDYRAFFKDMKVEAYVDRVFELSGVESVVMTNDPFDEAEHQIWMSGAPTDSRFHGALRLDALLNSWETAVPILRDWGYDVTGRLDDNTVSEVRRFLRKWIERMNAVYMAVSLPSTFVFPEDSSRGRLIERCILPVAAETGTPFAMMIGVKRLINPGLKVAGDAVAKGDVFSVDYLCANYPEVKFLVTMLSRENQHELCVTARKFRNLLVFGCWWFLNNPSLIEEITRMRFELLGESVVPQHSDARVLDQLVYKWDHSRKIIGDVLTDKYSDLADTGWQISEEEIRRDVADLFGRNFWSFVKR